MSEISGDGDPRCVHELFEDTAARFPDLVALRDGATTHTYAALNEQANRLARLLAARGVGIGDRVGLRLPRSTGFVAAALAVLKTGAAYVPFEAGLGADRVRTMAAENRLALLVAADAADPGVPGCSTLALAGLDDELARESPENLGLPVEPDDVMYVPYTSGSTGRPKGTEVPHRAVAGFFAGEDYAFWGPGAVTVHHSALSWDGHVLDLYPALLSGGEVVVHTGDSGDPLAVARLAADCGATVIWLTAAAFNTVVDVDVTLLSGLRYLMTGGETLSRRHVAEALNALPGTRIVNGYGPSECTVFSSVHEIEPEDCANQAGIPIGRAVGDRVLCIVDPESRAVPDGALGELCVGGPAVARGYLSRPALTAERFVPDPFGGPGARMYRTGDRVRRGPGGRLEFGGRGDDQVKIRGFRVEPGEVAERLRRLPEVRDAVVTPRRDEDGACAELIAHVVLADPAPADAADAEPADPDAIRTRLRAELAAELAPALVPGAFVLLDRMPLTANGKVDKRALPAAGPGDRGEAGYAVPRGATEEFLAGIWSELLDCPEVGREHDFFLLGGQSLLAVRMAGRIKQKYGIDVALRAVYGAPRLWQLAAEIDRHRDAAAPRYYEAIAIAPRRVRRQSTPR
ncbi:non-ribosomal peptide synthetase [Catenulispora sp. NL8]|uniref:Non-ribosomal peptide synthetase n=1 Tax=Catenulispora pinistramenti TaxID=2705254 RepID=A0ABS5KM93_9ACTN|nr:non-ribosomal peptide synthetase [Catenulispora pinistramenti]MBS2547174.1 non-ribosomal peptide synthetase [Catenulispora pinistramenti]